MDAITRPLPVMPPVYELPIAYCRWCKFQEVCNLIPALAAHAKIGDFRPPLESLVSRFAALVRPNETVDSPGSKHRKIFRYSLDGHKMLYDEVPLEGEFAPPHGAFELRIPKPYPHDMFVTEHWAFEVLYAVRHGATAVADLGRAKVGYRLNGTPFLLRGNADLSTLGNKPLSWRELSRLSA